MLHCAVHRKGGNTVNVSYVVGLVVLVILVILLLRIL